MIEISDLSPSELVALLNELKTTKFDFDPSPIEVLFDVDIPQWLTIKYRCVNCAKETRSKIQSKSIRLANREMICPFCRKISKMFTIHTEKEVLSKEYFGL